MKKEKTLPTYQRQRFLLEFIFQLQEPVKALELQKLVFLNNMNSDSAFYNFIPYKYGAYSFQLAEDLEILCKNEYISIERINESKIIKATSECREKREPFEIAKERGNELIRKAYRIYPYFTINSEMLERLFWGRELDFFNKEKQRYRKTSLTLFTIGYEGKSIEEFINILIKNDIKLLCDVRKNPLSRKFGFSKKRLQHITAAIGIKYVHIPQLGIESIKRQSLQSANDYTLLFNDYLACLPNLTLFVEQVYELLNANERIALVCFEKNPKDCHRHIICDYITQMYKVESADL